MNIGNSKVGSKLFYIVAGLVAYSLSLGGVARVIDIYVEWTGVIKRIITLYNVYIVDNISAFLNYINPFDFSFPVWFATYLSLCFSIAALHLSIIRFKQDIFVEGGDIVSDIAAATYPAGDIINLFKMLKNYRPPEKGKPLEKGDLRPIPAIIMAFIFFLTKFFLSILVMIFIYPLFVINSTVYAVRLYFKFDFETPPEEEERRKWFDRQVNVYNSMVFFWSSVIFLIISTGVLLKLNDELSGRCSTEPPDELTWICKSI